MSNSIEPSILGPLLIEQLHAEYVDRCVYVSAAAINIVVYDTCQLGCVNINSLHWIIYSLAITVINMDKEVNMPSLDDTSTGAADFCFNMC